LPDWPSIAVLPFENMSGDPEQEYFADGMVEEIITALSRIRWLFVIARNSSFTYKGRAIDVKQVGRELGVRYVLEGSVRKAPGRARTTAQLIEAETGAHLWADRFDGALEDVFELQDKVALSVAGVIEPTLQAAELQRSYRRPINHLGAYDLYLRAYAMLRSPARRVAELPACSIRRSRAIPNSDRHSPWPRPSMRTATSFTGAKIWKTTGARGWSLGGRHCWWPGTIPASSPMPHSRSAISAGTSMP
jgi:TolB-like protein